jgi:hypothetical protein
VAAITDMGTIEIVRAQRELWKSGHLATEWAERFRELFDERDAQLVET